MENLLLKYSILNVCKASHHNVVNTSKVSLHTKFHIASSYGFVLIAVRRKVTENSCILLL
jgi:hypothetical protein